MRQDDAWFVLEELTSGTRMLLPVCHSSRRMNGVRAPAEPLRDGLDRQAFWPQRHPHAGVRREERAHASLRNDIVHFRPTSSTVFCPVCYWQRAASRHTRAQSMLHAPRGKLTMPRNPMKSYLPS